MVKYADLLICDSKTIENYICEDYQQYNPKTTYIAYGTDLEKSKLTKFSSEVVRWYKEKQITPNNYYLVVGRFVPENNYETMIQEFMKSNTKKDFVLITNIEHNKFYNKLKQVTNFEKDPRIKFVGTVYDQELLKYIRENAFAYIHGHEVGGTNPSLLEAMISTKLNLLLDVGFNKEVGKEDALYWRKNSLSELINSIEKVHNSQFEMSEELDMRFRECFSWEHIKDLYETLWKEGK